MCNKTWSVLVKEIWLEEQSFGEQWHPAACRRLLMPVHVGGNHGQGNHLLSPTSDFCYSPPPTQTSFKQFYNLQSTSEIRATFFPPYDPYPFSFNRESCLRPSLTSLRSLISSRPASHQKSSQKSKHGSNRPTTELSPVNSIGTCCHKLLEQVSGFVRLQSTNSGRNRKIMEAYGSKESPELGSRWPQPQWYSICRRLRVLRSCTSFLDISFRRTDDLEASFGIYWHNYFLTVLAFKQHSKHW